MSSPRVEAQARVKRKQDARRLTSEVSMFLALHEKEMRADEVALFQRFLILLQRIGW